MGKHYDKAKVLKPRSLRVPSHQYPFFSALPLKKSEGRKDEIFAHSFLKRHKAIVQTFGPLALNTKMEFLQGHHLNLRRMQLFCISFRQRKW